ncbi:hypothetical protein DFJ77DRAFT_437386 [Powellomyces hirtus]|nr:hypothetical protein DFJ77DRAFT_437386 [Powellomyces hirtus]
MKHLSLPLASDADNVKIRKALAIGLVTNAFRLQKPARFAGLATSGTALAGGYKIPYSVVFRSPRDKSGVGPADHAPTHLRSQLLTAATVSSALSPPVAAASATVSCALGPPLTVASTIVPPSTRPASTINLCFHKKDAIAPPPNYKTILAEQGALTAELANERKTLEIKLAAACGTRMMLESKVGHTIAKLWEPCGSSEPTKASPQ